MVEEVEFTVEVAQQGLDNLLKEQKLYPPKRDRLLLLRDQLIERKAITEEIYPVIINNIEKIKPSARFEEKKEYWDCQRKISALDHAANMARMQEEIDNYDNQITQVDNEINRIEGEIPRIEKQIKDLEGE